MKQPPEIRPEGTLTLATAASAALFGSSPLLCFFLAGLLCVVESSFRLRISPTLEFGLLTEHVLKQCANSTRMSKLR